MNSETRTGDYRYGVQIFAVGNFFPVDDCKRFYLVAEIGRIHLFTGFIFPGKKRNLNK
jgi:hypothetical protein